MWQVVLWASGVLSNNEGRDNGELLSPGARSTLLKLNDNQIPELMWFNVTAW